MIVEDEILHAQVKKEADAKFLAKTSIYKSAWIVKEYKKRGGTFKDPKRPDRGLARWFREKWVDLNRPGQPCGRSNDSKKKEMYPLCRPTVKVTKDTPKLAKELDPKDIDRANRKKQKVKHTGRITFKT
jgi:hypothetical protein